MSAWKECRECAGSGTVVRHRFDEDGTSYYTDRCSTCADRDAAYRAGHKAGQEAMRERAATKCGGANMRRLAQEVRALPVEDPHDTK